MTIYAVKTIANLELHQRCSQQGCNSETFIGRDTQLNAPIFIKAIPKNLLDATNYFIEAQILYATQHPNVMEIRFASETIDHIFFVMDVCDAGSLQTICSDRFLTCREIIKYSLDFLTGLHFVHTKGFTHFDIKPSNILISQNGSAILSDFGLAKNLNNYGFACPDVLYDSHRPPESLVANELTTLSDIYQAGVTMYRLCNGEDEYVKQLRTHTNLFQAIRRGKFPDRNGYAPHIPAQLRRIINRAMHIDPSKRFQSVIDLQNALASIKNGDYLDWQFCRVNPGHFQWTRHTDTHTFFFETQIQYGHFSSTYNKKNMITNVARRVASGCCQMQPISEWQTFCALQLETSD